jgi:LacI family transcriptional regulator
MPIRLKDIADDLNLSKMTISKVLSGQTDISAETTARVLQRVKELNYIPNATANSLRTGKTRTLGLVVPSLRETRMAEIAGGIAETTRADQYGLIVCETQGEPELENQQIEMLLSRQVDAVLLVSNQDTNAFGEHTQRNAKTRFVFIDRKPVGKPGVFVGADEEAIGYVACEHLLHSGYKRVAYLRGPRTAIGDLRAKGFRQAMSDRKLTPQLNLLLDTAGSGESEYRRASQAMKRLLEARVRPDCVMAYTDVMALAAMDTALAHRIKVPEEMGFVGCGNDIALCEMRVSLTSVDMRGLEIGQKAARMATRAARDERSSGARSTLVSPRLVKRTSSAR